MRSKVVTTAVVSLMGVLGAGANSRAAIVVAPNAYANTVGGGSGTPGPLPSTYGTGGTRFQEVYSASDFGAFSSADSISQIDFRPRTNQFTFAIGDTVTVSNVIVTLSTTGKSPDPNNANYISGQFSNNVGADVTTVYSGPLTFTTTQLPGSTAFGYVLILQTPFTYQKGLGNLLLDFTVPDNAVTSGSGSIGYAPFDFASDAGGVADSVASAFGTGATNTIGANSTAGVVTQFVSSPVAVPEPASIGVIMVGALALTRRRRRFQGNVQDGN